MKAFRNYVRGDFEPDPNFMGLESVSAVHRDLAKPLSDFRIFAANLNKEFKDKGCRGIDLECGYSIDRRPNARAAYSQQKDIVVVNLGLALLLRNVFTRAINEDIVDRMLISGIYQVRHQSESLSLSPDVSAILSGLSDIEEVTSEENKTFLMLFTRYSLLYIFHHELAHIWNGHVSFIDSKTGESCLIDEAGTPDSAKIDLYRHALEMDADARAIHALFMTEFHMSGLERPILSQESTLEKGFYEKLLLIMYSIQVTISVLHIVISPTGGDDTRKLHPSARLRRQWMLAYVNDLIKNSYKIDGKHFDHILNVTRSAAAATISCSFTDLDFFDASNIVMNDIGIVDIEVHKAYRSLYPDLNLRMRGEKIVAPSYNPYFTSYFSFRVASKNIKFEL